MPVSRSIPYRRSRGLRRADSKDRQEDDETLLTVKLEPDTTPPPLQSPVFHDMPAESPHIPRPPNAFMSFRSTYIKVQKILAVEPESLDRTAMSCGAGEAWRRMNEEKRQPYVLQALAEKAVHALKYPAYRYAPGSATGVAQKVRKTKAASTRRASTAVSDTPDVPVRPTSPVSKTRASRRYETNPPASRTTRADPKDYQEEETYDKALLTVKSEPNSTVSLTVKAELDLTEEETYDKALLTVKSEPDTSTAPPPLDAPVIHDMPTESLHIPRPRNAFICFRSDYVKAQKTLATEPKSLDQPAMSCGAGEAWREMNEEQRQPYVLQAQAEKAAHALKYPAFRYATGVTQKVRKPKAAKEEETYDKALLTVKSEPDTSTAPPPPLDAPVIHDMPTESLHIPRPRNAFICFRSDYVKAQKTLATEPKSLDQTAMSCGAGEAWREMNEEQRQPYVLQAQAEKAAHALKYPAFRYATGVAQKVRKPKAASTRRVVSDTSDVPVRATSPVSKTRASGVARKVRKPKGRSAQGIDCGADASDAPVRATSPVSKTRASRWMFIPSPSPSPPPDFPPGFRYFAWQGIGFNS
ncbi:hypothetical protein C8R46DRAFT_1042096 [Mycena filopes]|nr:hypothetical protein C8R46DRAFT_1042096 [Mycena filopes]